MCVDVLGVLSDVNQTQINPERGILGKVAHVRGRPEYPMAQAPLPPAPDSSKCQGVQGKCREKGLPWGRLGPSAAIAGDGGNS